MNNFDLILRITTPFRGNLH